jgi:hypothetical protein
MSAISIVNLLSLHETFYDYKCQNVVINICPDRPTTKYIYTVQYVCTRRVRLDLYKVFTEGHYWNRPRGKTYKPRT